MRSDEGKQVERMNERMNDKKTNWQQGGEAKTTH